jgi:hypothetical protein
VTDKNVLDMYGKNAAVRCPKCERVYIVSKLINLEKWESLPRMPRISGIFRTRWLGKPQHG